MTTAMPSTAIVVSEPVFTDAERVALAGFLAGYSGLTREAYALDLRQFAAWCEEHHVHLFEARRADIECFGRDLEERGRARARLPGGFAQSPASTATPSRRSFSSTHQRSISAGLASTTSRTSPASIATNSALYL